MVNFFRSWTGIAILAAVAVALLLLGNAQLERRIAEIGDPLMPSSDTSSSGSPAPETGSPDTSARNDGSAEATQATAPEAGTTPKGGTDTPKPSETGSAADTTAPQAADGKAAASAPAPTPGASTAGKTAADKGTDNASVAASDPGADKTTFDKAAADKTARTAPSAAPSVATGTATDGTQALSGDTLRIGDASFRIAGLTCPSPDSDAGRRASATAHSFMQSRGTMTCNWHETSAGRIGDCTADTGDGVRRLSDVLRASGDCR
ncbi:hypothetical protein [Acidimangrovimonas sediminis]|uniref:hypothetical protein n=1 Tax=Acidimangrovimonas sediminis TaxID=2056283 RepID=UPI000C7FFA65|nr:hypothetical protein [Acidimangrovimonas sediminis]